MSGFNTDGVFGNNNNSSPTPTSNPFDRYMNQTQNTGMGGGTSMGPSPSQWGTSMGNTWGTNMGPTWNPGTTTTYADGSVTTSCPSWNMGMQPVPQFPGTNMTTSYPQGPYPPFNGGNGNGQYFPGGTNMQ